MRFSLHLMLALLAASPAAAEAAVARRPAAAHIAPHPLLRELAGQVSAGELHATIERLVGFGTRHTLSDTTSPTRGIGAARAWVKSRFESIGRDCGGCLVVETPSKTFTGDRLPRPAGIVDVLGVQRGTTDPDRVVVIAGHLDSRVTDAMNATDDAPGANDDGSGTAAVLEAARVLSKHRYVATIVYAVLSGEEQGLYGGKLLAEYARAQKWRVEADLNNDIIGNTTGLNGVHDDRHVRIFSEGTRSTETEAEADRRRYNGGEVDSPSRNLARYMADLSDDYPSGLQVEMIYRTDRFGRGGDQVPMLQAGFPAVRVTEAVENYNRQHQDVRVQDGVHYGDVLGGVDFPYLARVTRLNVVTLAALAMAPAPPTGVQISGAVSEDTTLKWSPAPGASRYRVWWRATTEPRWSHVVDAGGATAKVLNNTTIDDWLFGVSAVSPGGWESPVEFPGPAGAFTGAH